MAGSLNKVVLIGNLGADPEIATMNNGNKVANLRIATSESWKDKATNESREKTEWHRVVVFSQGLVNVISQYVKKGSKLYIEGQLQTREWDKDGQKHYTTEIVLQNFNSQLILLDSRNGGGASASPFADNNTTSWDTPASSSTSVELDDDIPF
ncbi:MAG: single-stranded DNA-binding protein [Alphaproteobacteria bacterium]